MITIAKLTWFLKYALILIPWGKSNRNFRRLLLEDPQKIKDWFRCIKRLHGDEYDRVATVIAVAEALDNNVPLPVCLATVYYCKVHNSLSYSQYHSMVRWVSMTGESLEVQD